jgi:hypothetical protein
MTTIIAVTPKAKRPLEVGVLLAEELPFFGCARRI